MASGTIMARMAREAYGDDYPEGVDPYGMSTLWTLRTFVTELRLPANLRAEHTVPDPTNSGWTATSGVRTNESDHGRINNPTIESATLSRSYTVWRNPDNRDDPVNLADIDGGLRSTTIVCSRRSFPARFPIR